MLKNDLCANLDAKPRLSTPRTAKASRKGHKKSRSGCFNCKRRKIKCPENLPACHCCRKVNLICEYPFTSASDVHRIQGSTPAVVDVPLSQLALLPDMRLFNHFLLIAYPQLPLGNEKVWVTDIAALSHSYEFLHHSLLGFAATHLDATTGLNLCPQAYSHRVRAITGLNKALSETVKSRADADALLTTCYALTCQSTLMGDSIAEILTMLHGAQLVLAQHWPDKLDTIFRCIGFQDQLEEASMRIQDIQPIDASKIDAGRASLEQLMPICNTPIQRRVLQGQLDIINATSISPREVYFRYHDYCRSLSALPHSDFEQITNMLDPVMQILLAHFTSVIALIYPVKLLEWKGRNISLFGRTNVYQIKSKWANIPSSMRWYLDWPMRMTGSTPENTEGYTAKP